MGNGFQEVINNILRENIDYEKLNNCSVLITGASGFIGTMLVKVLKEISINRHFNLRILALSRRHENSTVEYSNCRVDSIYGDITEKINICGVLDYIIHCASITDSKTMKHNPVETFLINVEGTRNVLNLAREKNIKGMIYISSMEVYGVNASNQCAVNEFVTEDMLGYIDLKSPRSSYSEGKRAAEFLCNAYYSEYGVPVNIARLAQTFGYGVPFTDNRVFAQFARSAVAGTDIILHTDGSSEGNYCHIFDTITGILTILFKGKSGEAYNVVNENLHTTIGKMAEYVAKEIAQDKINVIKQITNNPNEYGYAPPVKLRLGSEKLRGLGWNPKLNMLDMYKNMIECWKEQQG